MVTRFVTAFLVCCLSCPARAQLAQNSAPLPDSVSGWHLTERPQLFVGDELFKMIDGGAALYQEYGFDRAVSGKYEDRHERAVDAEIYAMSDAEAASGIFGITATAGEKVLAIGDEGELGEYFLVFRKGRYVVTVSGQNSDRPTMDGVTNLARAIESRIDSSIQTPPFIEKFKPLVAKGSWPVFLRGVIAVGNFYAFAPQNVFRVHEGVTGERDSTRFFVFRYGSAEESAQAFGAGSRALEANDKYSDVHPASNSFAAVDRDRNHLRASTVDNTIVVVIGRNEGAIKRLEKDVKAELR